MKKKLARIGLGVVFFVIVVSLVLYTCWSYAEWPYQRRTLKSPFAEHTLVLAHAFFSIELSPDLMANGVTAKGVGATVSDDGRSPFVRIETVHIHFDLFTKVRPLGQKSVSYVLQDKDGRDIGVGQVELESDLEPNQSQSVTIVDVRALHADRVVLVVTKSLSE